MGLEPFVSSKWILVTDHTKDKRIITVFNKYENKKFLALLVSKDTKKSLWLIVEYEKALVKDWENQDIEFHELLKKVRTIRSLECRHLENISYEVSRSHTYKETIELYSDLLESY